MKNSTITIESPTLHCSEACENILRALPDWFGIEESLKQYVKDADKIQSNNFLTYWGGRFSMNMFSEDIEAIISISPVCGAEYSFSDNFSIGGETRFNYTMNVEFDIMDISSHLFFRFYK